MVTICIITPRKVTLLIITDEPRGGPRNTGTENGNAPIVYGRVGDALSPTTQALWTRTGTAPVQE
jgi:hypothetical protein